ncbi:MAG: hypothetical protein ACRCXT_11960 [Paraclostridium sp.]
MAATSMPLQYKRLYKGPLDSDSIFESLEAAEAYAQGPTAYATQIIGVMDNGVEKVFIITQEGTLKPLVLDGDVNMEWDVIE